MRQETVRSPSLGSTHLTLLLSQDESATLEFKREWYKLEGDDKAKKHQKDELIKDILALANGNAYSAGETGILIVGADNKRAENGSRILHDVGHSIPAAADILNLVRSASNPPLETLEVVPFQVDEKRLFALVIAPNPHLYETTRKFETPTQIYSEYVVFIRRHDRVDIASGREREVIKKLKEIRFSDTLNAPPVLFGAGVGATIGGAMLSRLGEKITGKKEGFIAGLIVGPIMGGLFGALMGSSYKSLMETRRNWHQVPLWGRLIAVVGGALTTIIVWLIGHKLRDSLQGKMQTTERAEPKQPGG